MGAFSYTDLIEADLGKLSSAAEDWSSTAAGLKRLRTEVYSGLLQMSDGANWAGLNATVTKEFVRKSVKEVADLQMEAQSIASVLRDGHAELKHVQKRLASFPRKPARVILTGRRALTRGCWCRMVPTGP
ncbi:hypothetical protein [Streptomyces sp. NPDC006785]|uniref:hypothetical protein n=1 Tax=Streptomyces sp. NPDC006785 TaxID=3155461 RepID=UPI0034102D48